MALLTTPRVDAEPLVPTYVGRFGLFDSGGGAEFTRNDGYQYSGANSFTESGYLQGISYRFNGGASYLGAAAWVAQVAAGATMRIGLWNWGGAAEFTRNDGYVFDFATQLTETGFLQGNTERYAGGTASLGQAAWMARGANGVTTRIGFFDFGGGNEFTGATGYQLSEATGVNAAGAVYGVSARLNGGANLRGWAPWVANISTGITTRLGFWDAGGGNEFTRNDGYQFSAASQLTESGYLRGSSTRYNGGTSERGRATWVATATDGATTRIGFWDAGGGNEFTRNDDYRLSVAFRLTESGYVAGSSSRFNGGAADLGYAAWVAEAATGLTTRIGFWDHLGGDEFTRNDQYQFSGAQHLSESGYLIGYSERYLGGGSHMGRATWVANATDGATTRIGFWDQGGGSEFSRNDGFQLSWIIAQALSESGYAWGSSTRYLGGGTELGQAAWVATAADGTTTRIGFWDAGGGLEYTRDDGYQYSGVLGLTESGYLRGHALRYNGGNPEMGWAAWVVAATDGITKRIGLRDQGGGNEFTRDDGYQQSEVSGLTESGHLQGSSTRFSGGATTAGWAAWTARASDGLTRRIGLWDQGGGTEFTRDDGFQSSWSAGLNESGYHWGHSSRFDGGAADRGMAAWVALASDGTTSRAGLMDSMHTSGDGSQNSTITRVNESGYAWGFSLRSDGGTAGALGLTAWVFDVTSDTQTPFELSLRSSDNYAFSRVNKVREDGIALGFFTLFDGTADQGLRAFVWSAESGAVILDEEISGGVLQYGWDAFSNITFDNGSLFLVGPGVPTGSGGGQGVYAVQIPEPSALAFSLLSLLLVTARLRSRRRGGRAQYGSNTRNQ